MTCRAARRLLPLFAGGDLNASETSDVSFHLTTCAACRAEVDAFAAARSLLPLSSFSFGESERALIRRRVLDEIGRRVRPSPVAVFLLRPRFALAVLAGVVVLAASLVSPLLVRKDVEPEAVLHVLPAPSATPGPVVEHLAESEPVTPDRPAAISSAPHAWKAVRPRVPPSNMPGPAMRLEIQTGNVNVRIIWFAGGNSAPDVPSGPTSDTNDVS